MLGRLFVVREAWGSSRSDDFEVTARPHVRLIGTKNETRVPVEEREKAEPVLEDNTFVAGQCPLALDETRCCGRQVVAIIETMEPGECWGQRCLL